MQETRFKTLTYKQKNNKILMYSLASNPLSILLLLGLSVEDVAATFKWSRCCADTLVCVPEPKTKKTLLKNNLR
jgi:hypothetical protein